MNLEQAIAPTTGPALSVMRRLTSLWDTMREGVLRVAYALGSAIMFPFAFWVYVVERGSFSRIPVTAGMLLLCAVTFLLYFSTRVRFHFRFSWSKTLLAALLFALLGLGFAGVLSIIMFSYFCEAVSHWRQRRGRPRPSVQPNLGMGLVILLALGVFPLLNEMYYRGTQAALWNPDYNRRNIFYQINRNGFRGPEVPLARSPTPRLLFLGDSSPFGWPYRYHEAFPFVVQELLAARGIKVEVINAATIGQSIGSIRHQLPYFLEYRPDLVFLMTGIHYQRADRDYQHMLAAGRPRDTHWRPFLGIPPMFVELVAFSIKSSPLFSGVKKASASGLGNVNQRALESFQVHLRAVVEQIRGTETHLYLVDYPVPLADRQVQDVIHRIAVETGTDYIPLFDLIGTELKSHLHDDSHPDRQGHRMIAEEITRVTAQVLR